MEKKRVDYSNFLLLAVFIWQIHNIRKKLKDKNSMSWFAVFIPSYIVIGLFIWCLMAIGDL